MPFGTIPGVAALHLRITELLVHGWDLARTTTSPSAFPMTSPSRNWRSAARRLGDVPADRPLGRRSRPPRTRRQSKPAGRLPRAHRDGRQRPGQADRDRAGHNAHIFARPRRRERLRWCFETVLGCPVAEPLIIRGCPSRCSWSGFRRRAPEHRVHRRRPGRRPAPARRVTRAAGRRPGRVMRSVLDAGLTEVDAPRSPLLLPGARWPGVHHRAGQLNPGGQGNSGRTPHYRELVARPCRGQLLSAQPPALDRHV